MNRFLFFIAYLFFSLLFVNPSKADNSEIFNYFDRFLSKHVSSNGKVNYKEITRVNTLQIIMERIKKADFSGFSMAERKAFLINVYNLGCIYLISKHYPRIKKVTDIAGFFSNENIEIAGKYYSLDRIEKQLLMNIYKDARLHFVLNCAAQSCPPLLNKAYFPAILNHQLEEQTHKFLHDKQFGVFINSGEKTIYLSQIFQWYKSDFIDVKKFILRYRRDLKNFIHIFQIKYLYYNWNLNKL